MKTPVLFRKYPDGSIIALFPEKDSYSHPVIAYERSRSPTMVNYPEKIMKTIPAKDIEYLELYQELTSLGYDLQVIKKRTKR